MNKTGTQRLILRRFVIEDADDMYNNWASDPEVTRYLTWPVHSSVEVTRSLLTEWVSLYENGGYFSWAMEYKETGEVIGNISVVRLNEAPILKERYSLGEKNIFFSGPWNGSDLFLS